MILRTSGHLRIEENLTSTGGLVKKLRFYLSGTAVRTMLRQHVSHEPAEQLTLNQRVQGSSPCAPTTQTPVKYKG